MAAPDKIYLAFEDGFVAQSSTIKEDANGNNIFLSKYIPIEYIRKETLLEWIKSEMERLWELLPDADNPDPTQMELRYLGQYMQMEVLEYKLNSM